LPALQHALLLPPTQLGSVSRLQQVSELLVAMLSMMYTTKPKQLPLHLHLLGKVMVLILILLGLGSVRGQIVGLDSAHNKKIAKSYIKLQKKEVEHSSTSMREPRRQ
jgi:hypothetical protein